MTEERAQPFFAGVGYFLIWAFARYLDLFAEAGGMLGAAAFFFLCGAALVAVAIFWGRLKSIHAAPPDVSLTPSLPLSGWFESTLRILSARVAAVLGIAVAAQILLVLGMIAMHGLPLVLGKSILLQLQPVDPRDLFRGDYVILSYDLNQLPVRRADGELVSDFDDFIDRTVYVTIEQLPDQTWHGTDASLVRPRGGNYLRGRITRNYRQPIEFGIEAYYVQESKGLEWERLRNSRQLLAEVAVTPWGQAKLKTLRAAQATSPPASPAPSNPQPVTPSSVPRN
jgi:uncharacterized membrane-anchored protein